MFHIITRAYESCFACRTQISNWIDRCFGQHSWNLSVQSLKRQSRDSNKSVVGEPTTTTTVMAVNKDQTLLEINAVIAAMLDSIWSYFSAPSYMKGIFPSGIIRCLLHDDFPWPHLPHACLQRIYMGFFVRIYMRVCKKMVIYLGIKRKYTWQKTHVYRVAGMIASIRGKKPHVYRVIILKQMADHS